MSKFQLFQDELNFQSEGFWGDQGITEAGDMIEHFSDQDWDQLAKYQERATLSYKTRLASVLKACEGERAIPILVDLAKVDDDGLTMRVSDALNTFSDEMLKKIPKHSLHYESILHRLTKGLPNLKNREDDLRNFQRIRSIIGD